MVNKTKVINLFGSPGSGKSTVASGLFYQMKLKGYNVEFSTEWIKDKVFEDTKYPFKDQLYTFAKQNKKLKQMIGKVDYVICDSPLPMSLIYADNEPEVFNQLVLEYFNQYDNINFLLERNHGYQTSGRVHNENQSNELAQLLEKTLNRYKINYLKLQSNESLNRILEIFDNI